MKWACRFVTSLLAVAMLFGCATAYQRRGLTGGYHETRIDGSHYIVYFDGNGYASKDRVWYFWIYRCAQLTREQGYTYFSLAPVQPGIDRTAFDPDDDGHAYPAVLTGDADGHAIDVHAGGGGGGGGGHFIVVPGGAGTIVTWHSKALVAMYNNDVPPRTFVVRAQSILDALGEYIRTNGSAMPPDRITIAHAAMYAVAPDNTIVNVNQYLLAHVHPAAAPAPYAYVVPSPAIQPARGGMAVPPPPPSGVAHAGTPATPAPGTALGAATDALNARPSMAQSVANQLGCGAVQANGSSTYVASCGSWSVLINCSGDRCRPMHTIRAKSND